MFKKYIFPILGLALPIATASGAAETDSTLMNVGYPDFPELSISVPSSYKIYNKERYGIFSDDEKLEIAGTAYRSTGKEMGAKEFAEARTDSIPKDMPWYSPVRELNPIKGLKGLKYEAYGIEYEGVWPKESEPTSYIVVTIKSDDVLLSLTFTALTSNMNSFRPIVRNVIASTTIK